MFQHKALSSYALVHFRLSFASPLIAAGERKDCAADCGGAAPVVLQWWCCSDGAAAACGGAACGGAACGGAAAAGWASGDGAQTSDGASPAQRAL